jgi:hypothetical protein
MPTSEGSGSTNDLQQESRSGSTSIQGEATLILCSGETTSARITRVVVPGISPHGSASSSKHLQSTRPRRMTPGEEPARTWGKDGDGSPPMMCLPCPPLRLFLPFPRVRTAFRLLAVCPSHRSLPPSPARVEQCNGTGAQHGSPVC